MKTWIKHAKLGDKVQCIDTNFKSDKTGKQQCLIELCHYTIDRIVPKNDTVLLVLRGEDKGVGCDYRNFRPMFGVYRHLFEQELVLDNGVMVD